MISMVFPRSPLSTAAALVFYILWRLKKNNGGDAQAHEHDYDDDNFYQLVGVMFGDKEEKEEEHCCPICLLEFEAEDAVTHLPRCAHLFHMNCIEPWLIRGHLTCPLCRSFVLDPSHTPTSNVNSVPSYSTLYLPIFFFFCLFLHLLVEYL